MLCKAKKNYMIVNGVKSVELSEIENSAIGIEGWAALTPVATTAGHLYFSVLTYLAVLYPPQI